MRSWAMCPCRGCETSVFRCKPCAARDEVATLELEIAIEDEDFADAIGIVARISTDTIELDKAAVLSILKLAAYYTEGWEG